MRRNGQFALHQSRAADDRYGSPPEVAGWALMSALADSGRATGSAWVRVVPKPAVSNRSKTDRLTAGSVGPVGLMNLLCCWGLIGGPSLPSERPLSLADGS